MLPVLQSAKLVAVGVLAVLVVLGGLVMLPVAAAGAAVGDASDVSVERYGGADRYATSLAVAEAFAAEAGGSLSWVVLVSGERWRDAVVAAPVAGALGAPVLMTPPGELRGDALGFLERVGVSNAVVVGPEGGGGAHGSGRGVGAAVLAGLAGAGISAERVAGADRFATSVAAARQVTPGVMPGLGRTVIVASADVFADALVAGPFAARGVHPVLLSPPDELPGEVASFLGTSGVDHVVLMGGTAALSESVESAINGLGVSVTRLAGTTRYDTAVQAAELVTGLYASSAGEDCFTTGTIGIARARVPFDSFSAAPLLGRLCAPLVLADPKQIPADTAAFLDEAREVNATIDLRVFGGNAAVSQAAIDAYLTGEDPAQDETDDDETGEGEAGEGEAGEGEAGEGEAGEDETDDTGAGVLAAGSCGGSAADPPSRLVHDPKSEDPAWSPDCARIAYSQGGSLWTARRDGADARVIVPNNGAFYDEPEWSPDGSKIAFAREFRSDAGHWISHVWVAGADGAGRVQLTDGDVWDESPSWSPDGTRIVFSRFAGEGRDDDGERIDADRYLAVMNADGSSLTPLTASGSWDHWPAWSPDGESIAFIADSAVRVVSPDGGDDRAVAGGAFWNGGVSWSPDGTRLAFAAGDETSGTDIVTVEVDGIGEHQVTDLDGWAVTPKWSPDGQRIAFTHYDQTGDRIDYNGTRYVAVAGSAGTQVLTAAAICKPRGPLNATTAGFPLPDWAPARGTVRVAVLFVDFDDAQADHSTHQEAERGLPWAEEYLEKSSYRKLDIEYVPHHEWLRAPKSYRDYLGESAVGDLRVRGDAFYQDVLQLVDDDFDFSSFHSFAVILPSTHFIKGSAGRSVEADGATLRRHTNNTQPRDEPGELQDWGTTAAHELMHNLGLLDMYPYGASAHERPEAPSGQEWIPVTFGLMQLNAYYLADASENFRRVIKRYPDGSWYWRSVTTLRSLEMLAWSRWQLDWLHERQVRCVTSDTATVTLAPVARTGGAVAMAAVPISRNEVIVVESRRYIGYDRGSEFQWQRGGTGRLPALIEEGVLVYTVDTAIGSGQLPVKIAGDSGNGQVDDFGVLQEGESVTLRGYTITVTADDGNTHTVRVERDG